MDAKNIILGAGFTGLAAGLTSGLPVYEAEELPGGTCSSYYLRPQVPRRLPAPPEDDEAYRFELGGGHWIHSRDPIIIKFIQKLTKVKTYSRQASVYLQDQGLFIPYPIQNHLRFLGTELATRALEELVRASTSNYSAVTMADWLQRNFGPTLCQLFFGPFHALYTAGLWQNLAPQDAYKTPVDLSLSIRGAFQEAPSVGYNVTFVYPHHGLNELAHEMATKSKVHFGKRAVKIDPKRKEVHFSDGKSIKYQSLISTLPLNAVLEMCGIELVHPRDPYTATLVVNLGAVKGSHCPQDHWVYIPKSQAGFHRVGFYSNVDSSFLPASLRQDPKQISIYVEKSYPEGSRPTDSEITGLMNHIVGELKDWGWIEEVTVMDPTWVEVAYSWLYPGSAWKREALGVLERYDIYQVGRFARWVTQGIADSMRDGFIAGAALAKI